jgi:predicted dithiol-disulfide oxidoreductase (DUF899 family)
MAEHTIGTREEWKAARDELAKLEAEHAERNEEIKRKRLDRLVAYKERMGWLFPYVSIGAREKQIKVTSR